MHRFWGQQSGALYKLVACPLYTLSMGALVCISVTYRPLSKEHLKRLKLCHRMQMPFGRVEWHLKG